VIFLKKFAAGLVAGIINGLMGSGGGITIVLSLEKIFKLQAQKAHATAVAVMLPLTVVSCGIYLVLYDLELATAFWVTLGGGAGGIVGAKFLKKLSAGWLHKVFGGIMIFAAIRTFLA